MSATENLHKDPPAIDLEISEGVWTLRPAFTELDIFTSPKLHDVLVGALSNSQCREVVVETGRLRFIDASGIGVLAMGRVRAQKQEQKFTLNNVDPESGQDNPRVSKIIELVGLSEVFGLPPA